MQKWKSYVWFLVCIILSPHGLKAQNEEALLRTLTTAKHDSDKIKILSTLAEICDNNDILKYADTTRKLCEKAIAQNQKPTIFYLSNLAGAINNVGYYYSKKGDPDKALEKYQASLKIFEQIDDKKKAAYQLNNIAFIYLSRGDISTSMDYFYKNLKLQEQIKDTSGIGYSLNNIAHVLDAQGDYKTAMAYFERGLKMFEAVRDSAGMGMTMGNLALLYTHLNNTHKALEYYNRGLSIFQRLNNQYNISWALSSIGHLYMTAGAKDTAIDYMRRAQAIAEKNNIRPLLPFMLADIGDMMFKAGKTDSAKQYALRALQLSKENGNPRDIQKSAGLLKEVYELQGNYKLAFDMLNLEVKMKDSVVNETNRKNITTKALQYQYDKKELQLKLDNEQKLARKNLWIFISLFVAALVVLAAVFYTRQNKLKAKLDRMELEQQQYRAQMNPHFIFNCLNSIQHYIVHNDVLSANTYLSEFASLMRKTMDHNQLQTIPLQDEVEYLNSYLTLEQMRFENKFSYEITYAPDINMMDTPILPTIIQPLAENAIVHGLCYKENGGKLLIAFSTEHDYLVCKIEDNGIGRKASQDLKRQSINRHVSKGLELIKKRLALATSISRKKYEFDIIDKAATDGTTSGTVAILKFPINV